MKKILLLSIYLTLVCCSIYAQNIKYYPTQPQLFGRDMTFPFTGGFQTAFAQPFDLNNDGQKDLVFFDRVGNKSLTYLDTGTTTHAYIYAPAYEPYFNFITSWFLVRDFNRDGKDDFFVGNSGNVDVYKNISSGNKPLFKLVYSTLTDTELINISIPDLKSNIYVDQGGLPSFEDMDGDGDIDVMSLNILSTYIDYYQNMQVEAKLPKDSMALVRVDPCWGSMGISFFNNNADLGISCEKNYRHSSAHFGSTFCVFDEDGDGDVDMLHGDVGYSNLTLFKNGKKQYNWKWDTIISTDTLFPSYNKPVNTSTWPAAAYFDIDKDGIKDLYFCSNEPKATRNIKVNGFYKNKGTNTKPNFEFATHDIFKDKQLDIGCAAAPAFYDYDSDGDQDLVIGTGWDKLQSHDTDYALYLYKNIGTDTLPNYELIDTNWLNIIQYHIFPAIPSFGDLNGDKKPDLLIGNSSGRLVYFENQSGMFTYITDQYDSIDVGLYSSPSIADMNNDGKNDLVVGQLFGVLYYYERNTNTTFPLYDLKTDSLGKIYTNYSFYDTANQMWIVETEGMSAPCVKDINNDGKLDLVAGTKHGDIKIYYNISDYIYTQAKATDSLFYDLTTDTFDNPWLGIRTIPAVHNLDGDTLIDILVGNFRGGLNFYGTRKNAPVIYSGIANNSKVSEYTNISVYPNPANELLNVIYTGINDQKTYIIYNLLGQEFMSGMIAQNRSEIHIQELPSGIYILKLTSENGQSAMKFVKQ